MNMNRRRYLLVSFSAVTALAGCAGFDNLEEAAESNQEADSGNQNQDDNSGISNASDPSPEVLDLLQSESQMIDAENPQSGEFEVTIQNTGVSGNIAIALFWQFEEAAPEPESVDMYEFGSYQNERTEEFFFNSGERRTVEFTAFPPEDAIGYYFLAQPATYGANIRNSGADGRILVTMEFTKSGLMDDSTEEQSVFIAENSTKEVLFNVRIHPGTEWKIRVESL